MFVLKLLIGVLAIITFTKIGVNKSKNHEQIYSFYSSLCVFCNNYVNELKYSKKELETLINKEYSSTDFVLCLNSFIEKKYKNSLYFPTFLSQIEIDKLTAFFECLGKSDSVSQQGVINNYLEDFKKLKNEKYELFNKYKVFYKKLGFYVGLIMLIMVV